MSSWAWDSAACGLTASAALAAGFSVVLYARARLSCGEDSLQLAQILAVQFRGRALPPRCWFPEVHKAPLPHSRWLFWWASGLPLLPPLRLQTSDEELFLRATSIISLVIVGLAIVSLAAGLPILLVGTQSLQNVAIAQAPPYPGRYSSLDNLTLIRLLETPNTKRLTALTVLCLVVSQAGLGALLWALYRFSSFRRSFRGATSDLVWLPSSYASCLRSMGEDTLRKLLAECGLSSSLEDTGSSSIHVDRLSAIPDLRRLAALQQERQERLDALEVAEAAYMGSFTRAEMEGIEPNQETTASRGPTRSFSSRRSLVPAKGPKDAFQISASRVSLPAINWPERMRRLSLPFTDAVGRSRSGGSFTELFNVVPKTPELEIPKLHLGNRVSIDELGQAIAYPRTPTASNFGDLDDIGIAITVDTPQLASQESFHRTESPLRDRRSLPPSRSSSFRRALSLRRKSAPAGPPRADSPSPPPPMPAFQPTLQPTLQDPRAEKHLADHYDAIRAYRADLKRLNAAIADAQDMAETDASKGNTIAGFMLRGHGARFLPGVIEIPAGSADDVLWDQLSAPQLGGFGFWLVVAMISAFGAGLVIPILGLALSNEPGVADSYDFLQHIIDKDSFSRGLLTVLLPALLLIIVFASAVVLIGQAARYSSSIAFTLQSRHALQGLGILCLVPFTVWLLPFAGLINAGWSTANDGPVGAAFATGAASISVLSSP